jgi:16S rRNA (cytidine1402-2'-O)-methyltransferase
MLTLISTPIGNLEDVSIRAMKTLFSVDILLCEDTRRTGMLLQEIRKRFGEGVLPDNHEPPQLVSFYEEIEFKKLPEIISWLEEGKSVGLASDNGMPTISDPGFTLVREARKRNIGVSVVPGPNAALTALVGSGLPTNTFTFLGFLPEKDGARKTILKNASKAAAILPTTYILYCAPHKLSQTLLSMKDILGDIDIAIARELTKVHEEFWRGTLSEAETYFFDPKGEIVIVFTLG